MYGRIKSTLLNHFHKSPNNLSKEEKKRLRHSLAECQLTDSAYRWPEYGYGHAPLAPAEEEDDNDFSFNNYNNINQTTFSQTSTNINSNTSVGSSYNSSYSSSNNSFLENRNRFGRQFQEEEDDGNFEDPQDPIMPHFALSWNIQYLGSFPCSNPSSEYLGPRLDNFKSTLTQPQNVEFSVSLLGVRVCCEKNVLLTHSLRRICNVIGRASCQQVAYTALEPAGRTYRRLCHVFQAQEYQIEEIENVLGQAFEAQLLIRSPKASSSKSTSILNSTTTTASIGGDSGAEGGVGGGTNKESAMTSMIGVNSAAAACAGGGGGGTMNEKRSASTVFLNKFLSKKGSQTIDEAGCKRKRRPVSAVFTSAIHRFSNSASSVTPKRMTTTELALSSAAKREKESEQRHASPVPEEPTPQRSSTMITSILRPSASGSSSDIENQSQKMSSSASTSSTSSSTSSSSPNLVYDDKLMEWIWPIDATTTAHLEHCNYFVGLPSRDSLSRNLLSQPEGAFVVRYSESKTQLLVLSVRVPANYNMTGIAHYLVIRNENGYRLRVKHAGCNNTPFPTLQMMLTHHSVLEGPLPCTLIFVQWDKSLWKQQSSSELVQNQNQNRYQNRHSTALTKIDENRNLKTPTPLTASSFHLNYTPSRRCGAEDFSTPKRGSRNDLNAIRRSQFFDLDERRIVS